MESWVPQTKPTLQWIPQLVGMISRAGDEGIAINVDRPEGSNEVRVKVGAVLRGKFVEVSVLPRVTVSEGLSTDDIVKAELEAFGSQSAMFHVFVNDKLVREGTLK